MSNSSRAPQPLADQVGQTLKSNGATFRQGDPRIFVLPTLKSVPQGYTQMVGATAGWTFYLLAADAAGSRVKLLGSLDNAVITPNTYYYTVEGTHILLWSWAGNSMTTALEWDGSKLSRVPVEQADPTAALLQNRSLAIHGGDLEAAMQIDLKDAVHPENYPAFYRQAQDALLLAWGEARNAMKQGKSADAMRFFDYGISGYLQAFGTLYADEPKAKSDFAIFRTPATGMDLYAIDYGTLLAQVGRNSEAEAVLLDAVQHAPTSATASLALGDAGWNLGKQAAARQAYQKYLSLVGSNQSQVPARVNERLK